MDIYTSICKKHKIIGIDICGDSSYDNKMFLNNYNNEINNKANKEILETIVEGFSYKL